MTKRFLAGIAAAWMLLAAPAAAQFADQANVITSPAGTANAQTGTLVNATSYSDVTNVLLKFTPSITNTGDATLTLNSFATPPHFRKATSSGLVVLTGNELVANVPVLIMFDGTFFDIMSANTATLPSLTPQGYLTPCQLTAGSPVTGCTAGVLLPTGDVTSATSLYYEPAFGNGVPIYNGSNFVNFTFSELTLSIPSSRLANTLYDAYVFLNGSTPTICLGVAWTTSTAGSGSRGSGAGTAQITQVAGVWTNAVSLSCVNGASTFTVAANQGTVVGSVWIDGTAGQVTMQRTWGQTRKWGVYNFYNKQLITLVGGDATASWTYAVNTRRASNNNSANNVAIFLGLADQQVPITFSQLLSATGTPSATSMTIGIGYNSTTVASGTLGTVGTQIGTSSVSVNSSVTARYTAPPALGINIANATEQTPTAGSTPSYVGTQSNMVIQASWRG